MQKVIVGRRTPRLGGGYHRDGGTQVGQGRAKRQNRRSALRVYRTGFLNQPLDIIPAAPYMSSCNIDEFFTEDKYRYLLECATHYATLSGNSFEAPTGKSIGDRVCMLYHRFSTTIPSGFKLNIERHEERIQWIIYHEHDWENHTFYWMPVGYIEKLSGKMKRIALAFTRQLIKKNGLCRFDSIFDAEYYFDIFGDCIESCDMEADEKEKAFDLIDSYVNGAIGKFLSDICVHDKTDVSAALDGFRSGNKKEDALKDCFLKGLPFISGENCIMSYDYDPYSERDEDGCCDYEPVALERIIRYVYEQDDFFTNELMDMVNQELRESYSLQPTSFMILTPESKLFEPGDYPERFSDRFMDMIELIKDLRDEHAD